MSQSRSEIVEDFRRFCREHGVAATHQRQIVYQSVMASRDHPTPELLYERVRQEIPFISLGTVYKCLHTFLELGLLKEASLHHGSLLSGYKLNRFNWLVKALKSSWESDG